MHDRAGDQSALAHQVLPVLRQQPLDRRVHHSGPRHDPDITQVAQQRPKRSPGHPSRTHEPLHRLGRQPRLVGALLGQPATQLHHQPQLTLHRRRRIPPLHQQHAVPQRVWAPTIPQPTPACGSAPPPSSLAQSASRRRSQRPTSASPARSCRPHDPRSPIMRELSRQRRHASPIGIKGVMPTSA